MLELSRLRDLAISDSGFVFDPVSGHTYSLNATALVILRLLKDGLPLAAIATALEDGFEREPEDDVARDIDEYVTRLREHGLVR